MYIGKFREKCCDASIVPPSLSFDDSKIFVWNGITTTYKYQLCKREGSVRTFVALNTFYIMQIEAARA